MMRISSKRSSLKKLKGMDSALVRQWPGLTLRSSLILYKNACGQAHWRTVDITEGETPLT